MESPLLSTENLFSNEKLRGAVASSISGSLAAGLNLLGVTTMGLSATTSAFFFTFATGSMVSYVLDIMIAKKAFVLPKHMKKHMKIQGGGSSAEPEVVSYSDLWPRAKWLVNSFRHRYFFRFIVTVIIETLTGLAMMRAIIHELDARDILTEWKLRNAFVAIGVAVTNFALFGNILRFDWAYRETDQPFLNMVVLMWMALVMLVYATSVTSVPQNYATSVTSVPQ
jgi:hypothetical protein